MICPWCGCVFCWDDADMLLFGADRKEFCSKLCSKRFHKKRTFLVAGHYRKNHYFTFAKAEEACRKRGWRNGTVYRCCYRGWQITKSTTFRRASGTTYFSIGEPIKNPVLPGLDTVSKPC